MRLRTLFAILSVFTLFVFVAAQQADARVGGGSSSGSRGFRTNSAPPVTNTAPNAARPFERSMTQPGGAQATRPNATPGAQPGGFFNRPGLLGGLAAGFLGAGLFGMLFGNGLFGGMGGFASMLGLLLQIGLVIIVARLAWSWWQRRNGGMAYASASPQTRDARSDYSGAARSALGGAAMGSGYAAAGSTTPGNEGIDIGKADYDAFENLLTQTQAAYSSEDLNALRKIVTPEMMSYFADDLAKNASEGVRNDVSNVNLLQGDLSEAWREAFTDYATVAMRFSIVDKMIDRNSGRVVDGGDEPMEVTELWTFRRDNGGQWLLSAIQQA